MNHRFHLGAMALALLLHALPAAQSPAMAQASRGDTNGDGLIDGTDALIALQHARGKLSLTAEQQSRADVYPMPGTGGRAVELAMPR